MAIKITVGGAPGEQKSREQEKKPVQATLKIKVRKTLSGDYIISDHLDVDIIVKPSKNTIVTYAKDESMSSDVVYDCQDRLFDYLCKKGVMEKDKIQGGNVYGSLEASYENSSEEGVDATQVVLYTIGKFIEEERPYFLYRKSLKNRQEDYYTDPDDGNTTELGEVPHDEEKGSISKAPWFRGWGGGWGY